MSKSEMIDLGTVLAEIVSYIDKSKYFSPQEEEEHSALPALVLKVRPDSQEKLDDLANLEGSERLEITEVIKHDAKFSRLVLNTKDEDDRLSDIAFTLLVPTSLITVAFALLLVPGSFSILLLNSTKVRFTSGMLIQNDDKVQSHISFPPLSDARSGMIRAALADISDTAYANPLMPMSGVTNEQAVRHFSINDYGISDYARTAQGRLLSLLSSMMRGDETAALTAIDLAEKLAEAYKFDKTEDLSVLSPEVRKDVATYNYMIEYLVASVFHSTPRDEIIVPTQEMNFEPLDRESERSFANIVSSLLEDGSTSPLHSVYHMTPLKDELANSIRDPFEQGEIPENHTLMHTLLHDKLGAEDYAQVIDYARHNWFRAEVTNNALTNGNQRNVFLGMMLLTATRGEIISQQNLKNNSTYWLTGMLTGRGDSQMWEITALAPALENYDTSTLEALMLTNGSISGDPDAQELFFYASLFINGIAAFLLMEETGVEDIELLFENLGMEGPSIISVKALFMDILELLDQDFDEINEENDMELPDIIIPSSVVSEMVARWSAPKLSRALSLAIPILADGFASLEGHQAGTPEWRYYRKTQIAEILFYVDDIAPGVSR